MQFLTFKLLILSYIHEWLCAHMISCNCNTLSCHDQSSTVVQLILQA